jgi:hypothetical protein
MRSVAFWIGGFAAIIIAALGYRAAMSQQPFQMTIRPLDDDAVVQFSRPDVGAISPEFPVNLRIEKPTIIILDGPNARIPNGTVDFFDITLLPGRFQFVIGNTRFDVMSSRINVDGKDYDWATTVNAPSP